MNHNFITKVILAILYLPPDFLIYKFPCCLCNYGRHNLMVWLKVLYMQYSFMIIN